MTQSRKIAVISFSGNIGKTTVAAQMLKPRMPGATMFSVESINSDAGADGVDVERVRGRKFRELQQQLMMLESAIVDVGASNVEDFLKGMQQQAGSHEEFDAFVVPVVKAAKQQVDTVNTIRALSELGVEADRIRVVFNRVETDESVETEFAALFGFALSSRACTVNGNAVIYANDVYDLAKTQGKSISDIKDDPTNYRAKLRELTDLAEREHCAFMIGVKQLSITASKNLDDAFAATVGR
jgi:Flp pilus assembly CpaE family ATPase